MILKQSKGFAYIKISYFQFGVDGGTQLSLKNDKQIKAKILHNDNDYKYLLEYKINNCTQQKWFLKDEISFEPYLLPII